MYDDAPLAEIDDEITAQDDGALHDLFDHMADGIVGARIDRKYNPKTEMVEIHFIKQGGPKGAILPTDRSWLQQVTRHLSAAPCRLNPVLAIHFEAERQKQVGEFDLISLMLVQRRMTVMRDQGVMQFERVEGMGKALMRAPGVRLCRVRKVLPGDRETGGDFVARAGRRLTTMKPCRQRLVRLHRQLRQLEASGSGDVYDRLLLDGLAERLTEVERRQAQRVLAVGDQLMQIPAQPSLQVPLGF